jgi:hypothetical protein
MLYDLPATSATYADFLAMFDCEAYITQGGSDARGTACLLGIKEISGHLRRLRRAAHIPVRGGQILDSNLATLRPARRWSYAFLRSMFRRCLFSKVPNAMDGTDAGLEARPVNHGISDARAQRHDLRQSQTGWTAAAA